MNHTEPLNQPFWFSPNAPLLHPQGSFQLYQYKGPCHCPGQNPPAHSSSGMFQDRDLQTQHISTSHFWERNMSDINSPLRKEFMGLPWWSRGKESICQRRGQGLCIWPGKIPHAEGRLSPCPNCWSSHTLKLVLCSGRSHRNEKPAPQRAAPLTATREACVRQRRPSEAKKKERKGIRCH